MPYIAPEMRNAVNPHLDEVAKYASLLDHGDRAGLLAYISTVLALRLFPKPWRFWTLALVIGTFVCVVLEWYRRVVAVYENDKRNDHGDVF